MIIKIKPELIAYDERMQDFCKLPYPQHPNGCPNYGKKPGCPPNQKLISDVLNLDKDIYLIYTEFNVGKFAERMKKKHPRWTEKQRYCCLYWQGKARKEHSEELEKVKKEYNIEVIKSPEAYGVNINVMMIKLGIKLEWPPRKITRIVSLGGYKRA